MKKYKYLLKNIGLLTLSNFGSKVLSFILIPLYTSKLTTTEYGTFDMYSTTISLLIPILTINITSAVMRFCLDDDIKESDIFTIGFQGVIISIFVFLALVFINNIFHLIPLFESYWLEFVLLFIFTILYDLFSEFSRGIEKIKEVAITGILNSFSVLMLNILFLVYFDAGIRGYFYANILSYLIPIIFLFFKLRLFNYINFNHSKLETLKKRMYSYSLPMVFNTIGWWINNISDRYIVTWICGLAANGIYSIAYKIPSILNILQTIFNQAWTISAVKNQDEASVFYSRIYDIYNFLMVFICSLLIIFDKVIARILFANEFYTAWKYAPFLMISVVFGALSGLLGGILTAQKKSKILGSSTLIGAAINTILNFILIYNLGPIGAAIATLIAYFIVWIMRYKFVIQDIKLIIDLKKHLFSYFLLVLQAILIQLTITSMYIIYLFEFAIFIIIVYSYYSSINNLFLKLKLMILKKEV